MANKADYVDLGLACAGVCEVLDRETSGKELDDLSPSMREAIEELTRWVDPDMRIVHDSLTTLSIAGP